MNILRMTSFPEKKEITENPNAIIDHGLALTHILPLSKELIKKGHKIAIYSGEGRRKKKFEEIEKIQIFRTSLPQKPMYLPYGFSLIKNIKKIEEKIGKIDIIHAHNPSYAFAFAFQGLMPKKPLVITWHGTFIHSKKEDFLLKKLAKKAEFIAINEPSRKEIIKFGAKKNKIHLIHAGVDTKKFKKKGKKLNEILFVGRLVEWKNPETLIKAMKLIEKKSKLKLRIIGKGPLEEKLKKMVNEMKLNKKIIFSGAVNQENLPKYYSQALITLAPHLWDSFGKTIIESLSCQTTVIATNQDIPDKIKKCGVFYDYKKANNEKILAKEILKMIKSKKRLDELGKKGRKAIEKEFSWKKVAEKNIQVYKKILKRKKND